MTEQEMLDTGIGYQSHREYGAESECFDRMTGAELIAIMDKRQGGTDGRDASDEVLSLVIEAFRVKGVDVTLRRAKAIASDIERRHYDKLVKLSPMPTVNVGKTIKPLRWQAWQREALAAWRKTSPIETLSRYTA